MCKKMTNFLFTIIFLLISSTLFFSLDISPTYYTNDDVFMKQIVSGEMTGTPEAHILHIGYITGCFLKLLYTLLPSVPWYGILLFSYYALSLAIVFHAFLKAIEKNKYKLPFLALFTFTTVSFLWTHMIHIQFTTITAILCATSLTLFYLSNDACSPIAYMKGNIVSLLFFFISLELRATACIMFLPVFLFIALTKLIRNKKMLPSLLVYGSFLIGILLFTTVIEGIAYSDTEWNDFQKYNTARAQIMDYNGFPDYQDFSSQYTAHEVNQASYQAMSSRYQLLLDENIDTSFMMDMASISYHPQINITTLLKQFFERHTTSYMDRPLNLAVYILYFFTALLILFSRKWSIFYELFALFAGRMIIWFYLLLINRPQTRVTQGIYIAELLLLTAILFKNNLWNPSLFRKRILFYITTICCIGCLLFSGIKWGIPYMQGSNHTSKRNIIHYQNYLEIVNYFNNHEQNLYLLDTNSFSYFLGGIFSKTLPSKHNSILLGSWTAHSPWTDCIGKRYQINSYEKAAITQDNVFFVFLNSEATNYNYLEHYFKSKYPDCFVIINDKFITSSGLEFLILEVKNS